MANNTFNFVNIEGNQVPLLTRTEILTGEQGIFNNDNRLLYVFGSEHPSNFHFDLGEDPEEDLINYNWGRYDVPGIKRNKSSIQNPEGDMDDTVDEAGILIRNTSQFEIQVMGYFGNNFNKNTAVVASAENPNENVGYWAQIDSINKIQNGEASSRRYAWMHDQYGNEMERIYLYVQYTTNTVLQNATESTKATIESDALAGNEDYNIEIARIVGSALQIPTDSDNFLFTSPDDAECITQDVGDGLIIGQINIQVPGGVFKTHYEGENVVGFQSLVAGSTYEDMVTGAIVDRGYLLIDTDAANDAEKNIIVDHSSIQNMDEEGDENDMATVTFTWPTLRGNVTKVTFFAMSPSTGVISGSVEGSFLSGAEVIGKDINGVEMKTFSNQNGYYEFPREAFGEIKAIGGFNEITGETYGEAQNEDEIEVVQEDMKTDSLFGGVISPISTLLKELKNNEGLDKEEAIEVLVEQGPELFDLPTNLANKNDIKEYLKVGLNGLQNSDSNEIEKYAGFIQFSKKIAEQEQTFVDTNISGNTKKSKKKRACADYRQSLTRFMKRKKENDIAKYKTDYLAKAGTDSNASAINDSSPTKKDQFYLVLADAVEKVDVYLKDDEKLASSKADFKLKSKEMMEEIVDNDETITTTGKTFEDIAVEYNEAYIKRKMAAKEEQVARYNGNKSSFVAKKNAQTLSISKTASGYVRSGNIIKRTGAAPVNISRQSNTSSRFLNTTNILKFNPKIIVNGQKKIIKKTTGRVIQESFNREQGTGFEVINPNLVLVTSSATGFNKSYEFHGGRHLLRQVRGKGLADARVPYSFFIFDVEAGRRVKIEYTVGSEFRNLADAFVSLAQSNPSIQNTETYQEVNTWALVRDTDSDGVIDSEDAFPNDATRSSIVPTILTFRVGDNAYGNGSLTLKTYFYNLDNVDIHWGDGDENGETFTGSNPQHTYASAGDYIVKFYFKGTEYWQSNNRSLLSAGDSLKLIGIEQWGDFVWNSNMIWGEVNATVNATDVPTLTENFTGFTKSNFVFSAAATEAWRNIDLTPVRSIASLFATCYSDVAQFGIDSWDTSQITNMSSTFSQRAPGDLIRNWNTSNVTNMSAMFASSSVSGDTVKTKVVNLGQADEYVAWDVSKVTNFSSFSSYGNAGQGTLDITNWQINTSEPVNMLSMFMRGGMPMEDLSRKTVTLENGTTYEAWNTSQVTNIKQMFYRSSTSAININNASWETGNITNMQDFHYSASNYGIPSQWDRDISGWDLSGLTNKNLGLFNYNNRNSAKFSTENYDAMLIAWDAAGYTGISGNFGQSQYTPGGAAEAAHTSLVNKGWVLTDGGAAPAAMKMTVRVGDGATSNDNGSLQFLVAHTTDARAQSYTIKWGDGNTGDQDNNTHTYASAGDYQITITGTYDPAYGLTNSHHSGKIISIDQWGDYDHYLGGSGNYGAFQSCDNMDILATDACIIHGTSMQRCFERVGTLTNDNGSMNLWDTSAITTMARLAYGATGFTPDISLWQTDNVTDMSYMFHGAGYRGPYNMFNGDINTKLRADGNLAWNTASVTTVQNMFSYNYIFSQDISYWNTDSLTHMNGFVYPWIGSTNMSNDFSTKEVTLGSHSYIAWDVRNVTNFSYAFGVTTGGSADIRGISNWNTSSATNMYGMFAGTNTTDESWDLSTREVTVGDRTYTAWDVSNVTSMANMFHGFIGSNSLLNGISNWDMRSVESLDGFSIGFDTFNQDLSNWNTASLKTALAFTRANRHGYNALDTSLAGWDISNIESGKGITGWVSGYGKLSSISTENYDATLISFASQNIPSGISLGFGASQYTQGGAAEAARQTLIDAGVTLTDGGGAPLPFKFTTELPEGQTDFKIKPQMSGSEVKINWGDGNTEIITGPTVHTYSGQGTYEISIDPKYNGSTFEGFNGWEAKYMTTTVNTILQWGDVEWENNVWFYLPQHCHPTFRLHVPAGAENAPDLSRVTSLANMFRGPGKGSTKFEDLYNNIETWDVSTITDMSYAFAVGTTLATKSDGEANVLDLSAWDVSNVENFSGMFYGAGYTANGSYINPIGVNVTGWDTSSATNMSSMFRNKGIKTGYGNLNTSNVTNMEYMFQYSSNLDEDFNTKMVDGILRWDVSKVTNFNSFMYGANLSSFSVNYFPSNWRLNPTADFSMSSSWRNLFFTPTTFTDEEAFATKTITQDWYGGSSYTAWDMSNCTNLVYAFFSFLSGHEYNPQIDTWNITSKMTSMQRIFGETSGYRSGMTGIDRDISGWDFSGLVANGFDYWSGNPNVGGYVNSQLTFSTENYDALLLSLDSQSLNITSLYMGASQHTPGGAAEAAKNSLIAKGITITDGGAAPSPFKIKLVIPSGNHSVKIPILTGTGFGEEVKAVFGDGQTETLNGTSYHTYNNETGSDKEYILELHATGSSPFKGFNGFEYGDDGSFPMRYHDSKLYYRDILQWGDIEWVNNGWFHYMSDIDINATDTPDLSNVTSLSGMFNRGYKNGSGGLSNTNKSIETWDVSTITDMSSMFAGRYFSNTTNADDRHDLNNWDVSNVTNMASMFSTSGGSYSQSLSNPKISEWDTSNVTNMSSMFNTNNRFSGEIGKWDTSNVTNMSRMFYQAYNMGVGIDNTSDYYGFNTKYVQSADSTTGSAYVAWDVSNVTTMANWCGHYNFPTNQDFDLSNWNTSSVTDFSYFLNKSTGDLFNDVNFDTHTVNENWYGGSSYTAWDMSSVTNAEYMFTGRYGGIKNQYGYANWDTSNIENFNNLFYSPSGSNITTNIDLSNWNFESAIGTQTLVFGVPNMTLDTNIYDTTLINWSSYSFESGISMNFGNSQYTQGGAAEAARNILIARGVTVTDGGAAPRAFILRVTNETEGAYVLRPQISGTEGIIIEWGDGNTETVTGSVSHTFAPGTYDIKIHPKNGSTKHTGFTSYWDGSTLQRFDTAIIQWGDTEWENNSWFIGQGYIYGQKMKLSAPAGAEHAPNLSNVTSLDYLFSSGHSKSSNFTWEDTYGNLADWDVSGITSMKGAFYCLRVATENPKPAMIDLTKWDVSNVTDMSFMFAGSGNGNGLNPNGISVNMTGWNTGQVSTLNRFVYANNGTILGLDTLNTTNLTSLAQWDKGGFDMKTKIVNAGQANEYIAWDVSNVTNFSYFMYSAAIGADNFPTNWKINTTAEGGVSFNRFAGYNGAGFSGMTDTEAFATKTIPASESPYGEEYTAWDMSNASNLNYFQMNSGGNINMQDWNIASWQISSKLKSAKWMFSAKSANPKSDYSQDLGHWDISGLTFGFDFICGDWTGYRQPSKFTTEHYDSILKGWGAQTLASDSLTLKMGASQYTAGGDAEAGRNSLIAQGMTITDGGAAPLPFKMKIVTTEADETFTYSASSGSSDAKTVWGDGETTSASTGGSHTYTTPGEYIIEIHPTSSTSFKGFNTWGTSIAKVREVQQWGDIEWENNAWFYQSSLPWNVYGNQADFDVTATDAPNLSGVTSLQYMFATLSNRENEVFSDPNGSLANWDTSNVTDMTGMFFGISGAGFTTDLNRWDTSNVTSMASMFSFYKGYDSVKSNPDISDWDTSKVENFSSMFSLNSGQRSDLSNWNTSSATNMASMFYKGSIGTSNLLYKGNGIWDTSNVTNMGHMFYGSNIGTNGIYNWKTDSVTNMSNMFATSGVASIIENDLDHFNTKEVTVGEETYTAWNMSNVITVASMFNTTTTNYHNIDITGWNTSNMENVSAFLYDNNRSVGRPKIDRDLSGWDISNITNMDRFIYNNQGQLGPTFSVENYNATMAAWGSGNFEDGLTVNFGNSFVVQGSTGAAGRQNLLDAGWTITDGGEVENIVPMKIKLKGISGQTITLPSHGDNVNWTVVWGDGNEDKGTGGTSIFNYRSHTYAEGVDEAIVEIGKLGDGARPSVLEGRSSWSPYVEEVIQWGDHEWSRISLSGATNLTTIPQESIFTLEDGGVISYFFSDCSSFTGENVNWNLWQQPIDNSNGNLTSMFKNAIIFNGDISGWDTSNVTDMSYMFYDAVQESMAFTRDISGWDVSSVTGFNYMFYGNTTAIGYSLENWVIQSNANMASAFRFAETWGGEGTHNVDTIVGWAVREYNSREPNVNVELNTNFYSFGNLQWNGRKSSHSTSRNSYDRHFRNWPRDWRSADDAIRWLTLDVEEGGAGWTIT